MKYVRNLDDLKKYTFEFFDSFLPQSLSDEMVNYFLVDIGSKQELMKKVLPEIEKKPLNVDATAEYGEVILQLLDYRDLLKKFTELLLASHSFVALWTFLNRIFLQQIGDATYKSVRKAYSINERYFDRFIEIVMFCQIDKSLYTPFFIEIFNCDETSPLFFFKEPLKEYLDIFLKDGDDDSFISSLLSTKKSGIDEYASANTVKTLQTLIGEFVKGDITRPTLIKKALLSHKQESFNIIEEMLKSKDPERAFKGVQLLSMMSDDRRVKERLKEVFEKTDDPKVKAYLEKECGFSSIKNFSSFDEFVAFVNANIHQPQERLLGTRLKKFYEKYGLKLDETNAKIYTYVMSTVKSREVGTQLSALKEHFQFVPESTLNALASVVFDVSQSKHCLSNSKWALRLIALFGSKNLLKQMSEQLKLWLLGTVREKSASRYFVDELVECSRDELVDVVRALNSANLTKKQKSFLNKKLATFSAKSNQNFEVVKDKLADDFGFDEQGTRLLHLDNRDVELRINLDCSISALNAKTGKNARISPLETFENIPLKMYIKTLEKKVKEERKRLYTSFLEFRNYSPEEFEKIILHNNLLGCLARNLVWGRYRNDKLIEICLIKDDKLVHLAGNIVAPDRTDFTVAILQPMDCEDIKKELKERFELLFNQFDLPVFKAEDLSLNANYVDSLSGVFCNAKLFVTRLEKMKFKINDLDARKFFGTLVRANPHLNIITCVEFDKVNLDHLDYSITISSVRFYALDRQIKNGKKFNLDKTDALTIGDINPHIVSNELAQILIACKS
jgi:hypothetical protein